MVIQIGYGNNAARRWILKNTKGEYWDMHIDVKGETWGMKISKTLAMEKINYWSASGYGYGRKDAGYNKRGIMNNG